MEYNLITAIAVDGDHKKGSFMLKYYKENSKIITKLILYQVGAAILGIIVTTAAVMSEWLFLAAGIFSTVFYLVLLYSAMWEEGGRERIRIDGGRAEWKPWRGLFVSLMANIPNMILAFLIIFGNIFGSKSGPFAWVFAGSIGAVAAVIARFWEGMYLALIQTFSPYNPIAFLLVILPSLAVCTAAYAMGIHNRRIFGFIRDAATNRNIRH
mgnify:CR=1 FL=1